MLSARKLDRRDSVAFSRRVRPALGHQVAGRYRSNAQIRAAPQQALAIVNLAFRQRFAVLRHRYARPRLTDADRAFWVLLSRIWAGWRATLCTRGAPQSRFSRESWRIRFADLRGSCGSLCAWTSSEFPGPDLEDATIREEKKANEINQYDVSGRHRWRWPATGMFAICILIGVRHNPCSLDDDHARRRRGNFSEAMAGAR
jgi:hypothetical protein